MSAKKYLYKDRKYEVQSYDPKWPTQFEKYTAKIREIFADAEIEHIGSTSVPGMSGKPCIDILVVVKELKNLEDHIPQMEQLGFEYAGQFVMEGSRLFRIVKDNELLANIHFFLKDHPHIKEMIDLRNYLRSHPEEVEAYSRIKKELYSKYQNDYASYRKHKDEYMGELNKRVNA